MSGFEAALAGAITAIGIGAVTIARTWPTTRPQRAPFALAQQAIRHCPVCRVETAATIHGSALLCAQGHTIPGGNR